MITEKIKNKKKNNETKEKLENKKQIYDIPIELLLDAVKTNLPSNILEKIVHGKESINL